MLADPEIAEPGVADPIDAHMLLEIAVENGARSLPLARLILGVRSAGKVSRRQQRRHAVGLLERLLSLTYPGKFTASALAHRSSGAPYLQDGERLSPPPQVSLAHAGTWAIAAVSTAVSIGVDIEQQKAGRNTAQLAEFMGWKLKGNTDAEFYRRWTLWEAYTKCREGLLFAPGGPEFEALYAGSLAGRERRARIWHGLCFQAADNVQAAVAVRTSERVATTARKLDRLHAQPW